MAFLSRAEFGRRLNVTKQTVTRWARKGYVKFAADGRRILVEESERLLRQRLPKYRGGTAKGPAAGEGGDDLSSEWTTQEAVRHKEIALARLRQIEADAAAGKLIEVDAVKALWGRLVIAARNMMLSLPGRIAFEIPVLTATDRSIIERMVRDDLTDMSWGRGYAIGDGETPDDASSDEEDKK